MVRAGGNVSVGRGLDEELVVPGPIEVGVGVSRPRLRRPSNDLSVALDVTRTLRAWLVVKALDGDDDGGDD